MKPFSLPFSVFIELSKQIEFIEAEKIFSGFLLCQSKEGLEILENRMKQTRKKMHYFPSTKEKNEDEKQCNETFKKIRKLKAKLGGKLSVFRNEKRRGANA